MNFYRFTEQDFEEVPLDQLKPGDKLSWAVGSHDYTYGAVTLDDITEIGTKKGYAFEFTLPIGASVSSHKDCDVSIDWQDDQPIIRVTSYWWVDEHSTDYVLAQRG